MNLESYYAECCFEHSKTDAADFELWTSELPLRKDTTPFHSGPHSIRALVGAMNVCKPKHILEIGFCLGHSATIFLSNGAKSVTSIDISERPELLEAVKKMSERFPSFRFYKRSSAFNPEDHPEGFDTIFIDGAHDHDSVVEDIKLGRTLKCKWFIFDDWFECWGPGVRTAIAQERMVPVAIFGNVAVCVDRSFFTA